MKKIFSKILRHKIGKDIYPLDVTKTNGWGFENKKEKFQYWLTIIIIPSIAIIITFQKEIRDLVLQRVRSNEHKYSEITLGEKNQPRTSWRSRIIGTRYKDNILKSEKVTQSYKLGFFSVDFSSDTIRNKIFNSCVFEGINGTSTVFEKCEFYNCSFIGVFALNSEKNMLQFDECKLKNSVFSLLKEGDNIAFERCHFQTDSIQYWDLIIGNKYSKRNIFYLKPPKPQYISDYVANTEVVPNDTFVETIDDSLLDISNVFIENNGDSTIHLLTAIDGKFESAYMSTYGIEENDKLRGVKLGKVETGCSYITLSTFYKTVDVVNTGYLELIKFYDSIPESSTI